MYYTYVLYNSSINRHYIGCTNNLERRLSEHNRHQTLATNKRGFWKLVYFEKFETNSLARVRELEIKSFKGGNAFRKLLAGVVYR